MRLIDDELRGALALRGIRSGLLRLKWLAAATRFEIAMRQHDRALKLAYKYGYNPAQPRVPAGNPDGGEWTEVDANGNPVKPERIRLAGDIPTGEPPKIPKAKPTSSTERVATYKTIARYIKQYGGSLSKLIEGVEWLNERKSLIEASLDPPKTLEELKKAASEPAPGYDIHHVVEQTQAENDGFPRKAIDAPDNLVRIPRMRHWEINAWYQTENPDYGGQTPREYLTGRNWDLRRAVGLEALRIHGVLKP